MALQLGDTFQQGLRLGSQIRGGCCCIDDFGLALVKEGTLFGELADFGSSDGSQSLRESTVGRHGYGSCIVDSDSGSDGGRSELPAELRTGDHLLLIHSSGTLMSQKLKEWKEQDESKKEK